MFSGDNMSRVINVDCEQLQESGKDFLSQSNDISSVRKKLLEIINTIEKGWQGKDEEAYKNNFINYLKKMDNEYKYLLNWSNYFSNSSKKYNYCVSDSLNNLNRVKSKILEEEMDINGR